MGILRPGPSTKPASILSKLQMSKDNELELLEQARQGNSGAYRVLVERHMRQAYNLAFSCVNDHASAEDIAQEAFIRAHCALPNFRGDAGFGTWLYRIVTNLSLNKVKQRTLLTEREVAMAAIPAVQSGAEDEAHRADLRTHLERALHELPTMQRAVVILRHLDGLSTTQVSRILGCSEGTVKTHLFRGLKKLRQKLEFLKTEVL